MEGEEYRPDAEEGHDNVKEHVELGVDDPVGEVLEDLTLGQAVMAPHGRD